MRQPMVSRLLRRAEYTPIVAVGRRTVGRSRVPLHRRLLTARSALGYWMVVLLLALATATIVSRLMHRAAAAEHRFGPLSQVLVSTQPIRPGGRISAATAHLEDRPEAQLPVGTLDRIPVGASVSGPVARGEVLTRARLQAGSTDQRKGTAAIAVSLGDAPLAVRPGDQVDVYATYDPSLTPLGVAPTSRVAVRADVLRAGRTTATLVVRDAEAPGLAAAVSRATVIVALVR